MSSVPFFLISFVLIILYAMWRGGGPERVTAGAYVLALAGSASVGFLTVPGNFRVVSSGLFLVDFMLLVGLCFIAVKANRWWPIPATGCQMVAVLVHAGKLLDPAMLPQGYVLLTTIWSWPMIGFLALGTWAHRQRLAERIIVSDWKTSFQQRRFLNRPGQQPS